MADRVIIAGPVSADDKNWYYANCEAFAFPSLAEGFGLPVIEAMNHGKPVFLSRLTALPEWVAPPPVTSTISIPPTWRRS